MDRNEAKGLLAEHIERLRALSYGELRQVLDHPKRSEIQTSSGTTYHLEVQVFKDSRANENLRVMTSIGDGGWRSFAPFTEDFIMAPDGSFVGE